MDEPRPEIGACGTDRAAQEPRADLIREIHQAYSVLEKSSLMVNDHTAFRDDAMPFAGLKQSGLGVGGMVTKLQAADPNPHSTDSGCQAGSQINGNQSSARWGGLSTIHNIIDAVIC